MQITWRELLDIGLVAFIYYRLILLIKGTRAVPVLYGLVLVIVLYYVSGELGLHTLNWFLANFLGSVFLVVIILFQRDIRKALAEVGAGGFWRSSRAKEEQRLDEVIRALSALARVRMGALVVFEGRVPLGDVVERGVEIGGRVSRELLMTIFYPDTPLHDGAVIIRGETIVAAGCILPLSPATDLTSAYGTRHRAAIGITEETDAVVLVVSEERGEISLVAEGQLIGGLDETRLLEKTRSLLTRK